MKLYTRIYALSATILIVLTVACTMTENAENRKEKSDINNEVIKTDTSIDNANPKTTRIARNIGDIHVEIIQYKDLSENANSMCSAEIKVYQNDKLLDSMIYNNIEAVGGDYGLLVYDNLFYGCLIISKFGDYDGQTIIISEKGNIFTTIGGIISVDSENGLLFSEYLSDIAGFSVFDVKNFKELINMSDMSERPVEFYTNENRYFFKAENDESGEISFWETDLKLERIMVMDAEAPFMKSKKLKNLTDYTKLYIQCE